ncbi:MAG TPA: hypothetical protein VE860_27765 [Chthoniobacterales bacterium]|nr:hypothetical protein [Chthoniobacterales bacterium]
MNNCLTTIKCGADARIIGEVGLDHFYQIGASEPILCMPRGSDSTLGCASIDLPR